MCYYVLTVDRLLKWVCWWIQDVFCAVMELKQEIICLSHVCLLEAYRTISCNCYRFNLQVSLYGHWCTNGLYRKNNIPSVIPLVESGRVVCSQPCPYLVKVKKTVSNRHLAQVKHIKNNSGKEIHKYGSLARNEVVVKNKQKIIW